MSELEPHYSKVEPEDLPKIKRHPVHVVLDNIRSAFNVGSIFRTSDAAAVEHLHLCGLTAYPPNTKLEKTALGAMDYVPWTYYEGTGAALDKLRSAGIPIAAVEVTDRAVSYLDFDWPRPVAVVFGHEVRGVHPDLIARCDYVVQIPMFGFKNSMNVATAYGVVLYEILRRWGVLAKDGVFADL